MRITELIETVQPLPDDMPIENMIEALERRLTASRRGLSLAHRMKNPLQKKKHFASVLTNMNLIRGQLSRVIKQMEQFTNAEQDHENSEDTTRDPQRDWSDTSAELR